MSNPNVFNALKVALVYDHVTTAFGGAELVLQTLHELFPAAPLYTSVYNIPSNNWAKNLDVKTSFLQLIPLINRHHQLFALAHPLAFESLDLSPYDLIISVSNGPAKGVLSLPHQLHVNYLLTPTRYLSPNTKDRQHYFRSQPLFSIPGLFALAQPFLKYLERWDRVAAWRPDFSIAISKLVAERSETVYNRTVDAVVYPPFKKPVGSTELSSSPDYFLCLTRLTQYKRVDLAIEAALRTHSVVVIAGTGIYKQTLINQAGNASYVRKKDETLSACFAQAQREQKTILFVGSCTENEKAALLSQCQALVMPGEEDFGLVGLEAASVGKPVITYYKSGIAEILREGIEAVHLKTQSVSKLIHIFKSFDSKTFSPKDLKKTVEEYQTEWFKELFHKTIYHFWQQHSTI